MEYAFHMQARFARAVYEKLHEQVMGGGKLDIYSFIVRDVGKIPVQRDEVIIAKAYDPENTAWVEIGFIYLIRRTKNTHRLTFEPLNNARGLLEKIKNPEFEFNTIFPRHDWQDSIQKSKKTGRKAEKKRIPGWSSYTWEGLFRETKVYKEPSSVSYED